MSQVPLTPIDPPCPAPTPAPPFFSRWQLVLIGCTGAAVLAGVVWLVLHVKNVLPIKQTEPSTEKRNGGPSGEELPPPRREPTEQDPSSEEGKDQAPPKGADENPPPGKEAPTFRYALGTVTGISIRQAYLNVGLLADGVEVELYTVADATKVLDRVTSDLATVDRQLEQLTDKAFDEDDRVVVALARKILGLLRTQAKELRAYWADNSKDAERFQKAREESRAAIEELLGGDE